MKQSLLILFIRNAIAGKLNPAIARLAGEEHAVDVYVQMLGHLEEETAFLPYEKLVLYSDMVEANDVFDPESFEKEIQAAGTRGERLADAFGNAFARGYDRVVLVTGETMEMGQAHIVEAFESLLENEVVIGPSEEGGYYLLGMRQYKPELFEGKEWNGEDVFLDMMLDLQRSNTSYRLLDTLPEVSCNILQGKFSRL
jgi:glycosyltransferase A (GT-A) superfamily protein (DUF2064 family)